MKVVDLHGINYKKVFAINVINFLIIDKNFVKNKLKFFYTI